MDILLSPMGRHKSPPPDIVIGRLPLYLRALDALAKEDAHVTSSYELGERLGMSSAQIRKDLSHFGDFGKQGTGYQIHFLIDQLRQILHVNREWLVIIVGAGHIGQALVNYRGFSENGFKIVGVFDNDEAKIGQVMNGYVVQPIAHAPAYIRQHDIKIAMLTTPAEAAQATAEMLVEAGVRSILNYAPTPLTVPEGVQVQSIDPVSRLQHMTYYLNG
jgi:redox-sensing transcriptional repressor